MADKRKNSVDVIDGFDFECVLQEELDLIHRNRHNSEDSPESKKDSPAPSFENAHASNLTGMAFSGGGIRSATFNLGLIQAFAKVRQEEREKGKTGLLSRFDYLSTVSGGGYIGSWLSAWLHREAEQTTKNNNKSEFVKVDADFVDEIQSKISTRPCSFGPEPVNQQDCFEESGFKKPWGTGFPPLEHAAVRYLRRYSNYLTPHLGLSGDTLALFSLFLRNLVLLQLALISLVAAILFVPYCFASFSVFVIAGNSGSEATSIPVIIVGLLMLIGAFSIWRPQLVRLFPSPGESGDKEQTPEERSKKSTSGWWMACSTLMISLAFWLLLIASVPYVSSGELPLAGFILFGMLGYTAAWLIGPGSVSFFKSDIVDRPRGALTKHFIIAMGTGAVFGFLIYLFADVLEVARFGNPGQLPSAIAFIPPLMLLILSFTIALHLGIARNLFNEQEREWWARLGGFVLFTAAGWVIIFSTTYYAPPLFHWLGNGGLAIVIAWAGTSGIGAWIARSAKTGDADSGSLWKMILTKIAPWLFIGGLALLISYGLYVGITLLNTNLPSIEKGSSLLTVISLTSLAIEKISLLNAFFAFSAATGLFFFISWRLDINAFSAHSLYRNRLVRAYLGASRAGKRNAHAFTGFDPEDDLRLALLAEQRPIPILNTTINMTGGDDLAWQTRRAASFTFTPQFVGYETKSSQGIDLGGYRRTWEYAIDKKIERPQQSNDNTANNKEGQPWHPKPDDIKGIRLGTAFAISGAAASPNMGFNTSKSVAALLTAFNLRLGYWAGNTNLQQDSDQKSTETQDSKKSKTTSSSKKAAWRKKRASLCAKPVIAELTGSANAESDWINLSDGGHFDNLGIYELVRRRCRLIVATDAGCDPEHQFQDLANTIRKCWTDLGVHIFFPDLQNLCLDKKQKRCCRKHGSLGLIEYPDRRRKKPDSSELERERYGLILYLKCSLTKSELDKYVDILQYARTHEKFPHETTADQFFDENQFEAYRHLGFCVGEAYIPLIEKMFNSKTKLIDEAEVFKTAKKINRIQEVNRTNSADSP